jgi:O-antigen/teichoic acid export membrane protein
MNTIQTIAKNVGASGVAYAIVSLLGFFLLIYSARYLGPTNYGIYNFAYSFCMLLVFITDIGIGQLLVRDVARDKSLTNQYLTNASILKMLLSIVTFTVIVLTINLLGYPPEVTYVVYIFGLYAIINSFAEMLGFIFQSHEKMEYASLQLLIEKSFITGMGIYLLSIGYGLVALAYVFLFAAIIKLIFGFLFLFKIERPKFELNTSLWKTLTIGSLPFGLNSIFSMLFYKIDSVLLSYIKGDVAVGIYAAAYNPLIAISSISSSMIVPAIYPVMSRYFKTSKSSLGNLTIYSSKYAAILGFPIAVGCFVLANKFILFLYGIQYTASIFAFQILALFVPFRFVSSILGSFLPSIDKPGIRTLIVGISAVINIILNLILIPKYSFIGASIATVISEAFVYITYVYFTKEYFDKTELHKSFVKPIIAAVLMGIMLYYLINLNLFLLIILAMLFYFFILTVLGTFTDYDKQIFRQILNKVFNR